MDHHRDNNDCTNIEPRLLMLTGALNSGVRGGRTMLLAGAIIGQGIRILINTSTTHSVTNSSTAYAIGPLLIN